MATTVTKVVDPDSGAGYDYHSLFDWEAAQQGDLTGARNEISVAKCRCTGGTADTAAEITGWTTSTTQYVKVWTDTSESYRHNGEYSTGNKYRIEVSATDALKISITNCKVIGIQVKETSSADWTMRFGILIDPGSGAYKVDIESCIVWGVTGSGGKYWYAAGITSFADLTGSIINIVNCALYSSSVTDDTRGFWETNNTAGTVNIYNCTFKNFTVAITQASMTVRVKNCGFVGCTGATSGTITDATTNSTTTPTFEGGTEFHLASNDTTWIGAATNLYNDANYPFQTDIDGQDRGGAAASWDIGADEYVSSAAIEQEGFRFRNDDGSESAATWKANQDTNITLAADTAARIRMLLNATGDPASIGAQLEYRYKPSGGAFGSWTKVN
jgi:hypothetical protein